MKAKIIVFLIISLLIGPPVWKSDLFQRTFFPKKYWSNKVEKLEIVINALEKSWIPNFRYDQKKMRQEYIEYYNFYIESGMNDSDAKKESGKNVSDISGGFYKIRETMLKVLEKDKIELENAKKELDKLMNK